MPDAVACSLEHWSSTEVAAPERYAFWREVMHNWVTVTPLGPPAEVDAAWSLLRGAGAFFGSKRSSAHVMHTGPQHVPPGEDMVVLSLLQAGSLDLAGTVGDGRHFATGALGLFAPRLHAQYRFSEGARQTYLALPRTTVLPVLGREPVNLELVPARCPLAPMLASQLAQLAALVRRPVRLGAAELAGALEATQALALLALRSLAANANAADEDDRYASLAAGRHAAAMRFMEREAHRHELDAARIAAGIGCSRTRLYEAFAARGTTVMASLRELRLERARGLLEAAVRPHVGALAWRCGFPDQANFARLFRARFGMAPLEWHRAARAGVGFRA